ncbi:uncharacterized protein C8R40DRAFT_1165486 [Lentinula edodes]|uniref:uncharacterized protein n=1 Tax=Lentinula edodes TaxID=5353 RepID=UPI001E8DAD1A|nr:uncharacterized protein C8R40DRAFT_1165486 [Lentinula edodes]KAH7880522.1 hypothetical protein C8R40DRAFT_1165486 [Lentinula edodes]
MSKMQRKKGPPSAIKTDMPQHSRIAVALGDPASASDSDHTSSPRPMSLRNMKKLSLTLPSAQSSSLSLGLQSEPQSANSTAQPELPGPRPRRPSVISLPPPTANPTVVSFLQRNREQEGDPAVPYADGPIQIIPGIWLGSEDNARDWTGLIERGIKSILNVAKEVASPFEPAKPHSLRVAVSTPNLNKTLDSTATYHPPHPATGRPGLHYLKLPWSHGQRDLVADGFPVAMRFTDEALQRGDGVLIHCQCGISRSATLTIAIVMRAAAERSSFVPSEIWALKGMQPAYDYVKEKSAWIGPNMSLIYQLLDYERKLKGQDANSPSSDRSSMIADEEAEWSRRRQMMEDEDEDDHESRLVMQEAQALDKAMEDRVVARKNSASSMSSHGSSFSGVGMGPAWRSRYSRKRTGSVASNTTNGSLISEDLVEEEEEQELLGVGGGFESDSPDSDMVGNEKENVDNLESSTSTSSSTNNPHKDIQDVISPPRSSSLSSFTPRTARPKLPPFTPKLNSQAQPPPSAPVWKTSFGNSVSIPPPSTAFRSSFDLSTPKANKRRPTPLGTLAPIPPSPIAIIVEGDSSNEASETESSYAVPLSPKNKPSKVPRPTSVVSSSSSILSASSRRSSASASSIQYTSPFAAPPRMRTESRKPAPPPLHLRHSVMQKVKAQSQASQSGSFASKPGKRTVPSSQVSTPSQTLFVFPPSPTLTTRTPSTMTLTSATPRDLNVPFPSFLATPRVSTFRNHQGKTRSFIGLSAPPTPTTGFSRVDVRGYVALK